MLTLQASTEVGDIDGDEDAASSEVEEEPSRRGRGGLTQEEQDDFARELAKLMSEAPAERPKTSAASSSSALPLARVAGSGPAPTASDDQHMAFTLLTRNKGGKAAAKTVEIPIDAPLAVQTRAKLLEASEERKQLKKLVLNYERELEVERRSELQADAARNGIKVTFAGQGQPRGPSTGQSGRGRGQGRPPVNQRPAG